jgi:hypothetical protein
MLLGKMKKGDKKAQFYLVATIIIAGLLTALTVAINYSTKTSYSNIEEVAKNLRIESEHVMDYEINNGVSQFEDFSKQYSSYAKDFDIYFIIVDLDDSITEAYKYTNGIRVNLNSDLAVSNEIRFRLNSMDYTFKLEKGKNFYFVIVSYKGGETYVLKG